MLRYIMIVCVSVFVVVSHAAAQQYQDVVYLKDGSIIRGVIIEQIPNESLKIQTQGGSIFVFKMSEVIKIVKEPVIVQSVSKKIVKAPGTAVGLSFIFVGAGQLYNDQSEKAALHWVVAGVSAILIYTGLKDGDDDVLRVGALLALGNWVYSMIDAYSSAQRINEQHRTNQGISLLRDRLFLEPYSSRKERGAMLSLRF